jgi:hypothetical protein
LDSLNQKLKPIKNINNDLSIINIHYIIRKHFDREYIKLVSIDKEIIEDGVQYYCAKRINVELIITDNIKDYKHSDIRVILARDFYDEFVTKK